MTAEATQAIAQSRVEPGRLSVRLVRAAAIAALGGLTTMGLAIVLLRFITPPATPLMLIRRVQGYPTRRQWVGLYAVAPAMREAVIAAEDLHFCSEPLGFDFQAMRSDFNAWRRGGRAYGASTITMQTARSLFLWPDRSVTRKFCESALTPLIALIWPKHRILEVYLNVAEFGPGLFGVEAASRFYFNKRAAALSLNEAARLAAILPNPLRWSPTNPNAYVRQRAGSITASVYLGDSNLACSN